MLHSCMTPGGSFRHTGQSAISNILNGSRRVKVEEADIIYSFLGISRSSSVQMVPVIGLACAGNWKEAILAPPGGMMPIPSNAASRRSFAVEVKGDSMDHLIPDGGFVIVDPEQTQLFSDRVYLIENEEHEAQVKRYRSNPAPRASLSGRANCSGYWPRGLEGFTPLKCGRGVLFSSIRLIVVRRIRMAA